MNVQLIKQFARISVNSIANDMILQWQKQDAVKKDDIVFVGVQQENGQWYITFRVEETKQK